MYRTFNNGELRKVDNGKNVILSGWVKTLRNLGSIGFLDLRDRYGITQLVFLDPSKMKGIGNEDVIQVKGKVRLRQDKNPKLPTGDIEVVVDTINVLSKATNPPFIIDDNSDALEETRLKYRYLDLRRPVLQSNLKLRAKITKSIREFLDSLDFIEIETPLLCLSTPEGARDFLVPSRLNKGSFYALPQSPQIYKQLLMVGGLERYYQIAKCLRDEDLRSDRQPEFTQVDIETSFLEEEDILSLVDNLLKKVFKDTINHEIKLPLKRIPYLDAIDKYGSDKPDTRFDLTLFDVKDIFKKTEFINFKNGEAIRAFYLPKLGKEFSRKVFDEINLEAKKYYKDGLYLVKKENNEIVSSLKKFFDDKVVKELNKLLPNEGDALFIGSGPYLKVSFMLGAMRKLIADKYNLYDKDKFDLLWVTSFPLFEKKDDGSLSSLHHPFTLPSKGTIKYLDSNPEKVLSSAYDIIINGQEVGGGSLRIHDLNVQKKIFKVLGLSETEIKEKFSFFVDALKYGTPPHGGLAFGLDRLTMILAKTNNIRDVIAFPKNLKGVDMMSEAPKPVSKSQLDELGIKIIDKNNK